jgi:hypothetical protein
MKRKLLLALLFVASVAKAAITTPYPVTIEIDQINGAEKERLRLCQGHKKYDKQPTGFYIEAGKKLEVNVEILTAADANAMPTLTVGTLGFNVDGRSTGASFTLKAGVNTITNHSGGLVWLDFVTNAAAEPKGKAQITFTANSEQVRAPRYVFGVTTDAEFTEMMSAYQTPDVLFHSDYIAVAATREAAELYSVGENKNAWMEAIHILLAKEDEISGMDNSDANPVHHRLKTGEIRFLLVENTSVSPHAASSGYTGYPHASRARYLTKLGTSSNNSWMLGHELGHQHQQPAYQINLSTESTVNIYSYVAERYFYGTTNPSSTYNRTSAARWTQAQNSYLKLPFSKRVYDMDTSELESIIGFNRDELRFMPWEQFFLIFGDQFYKTLHRVVREEKVTGGGADERRAYLIWKASQVSGYDLTEFFNLWGIRVTDAAIKTSLRAKMAYAKDDGSIIDLSDIGRTPEELTLVTGQAKPAWTPLPLRGITSSGTVSGGVLDRSNWSVTTNIQGAPDATVGGDKEEYIIDGNSNTAFVFVKPGKTLAPVTAPADYLPTFVIDMKEPQSFNFVKYAHRSVGNTYEQIRARQFSIYGSTDSITFTPIVEHYAIDYAKNDNEITVGFAMVTYRYIKVVIEDWNNSSGMSVQVAEFNAGIKEPELTAPPLKYRVNVTANEGVITSQAGVNLEDEDSNFTLNFSLEQGYGSYLKVTVDGDAVEPVKNGSAYSLTLKVVNHIDINISATTDADLDRANWTVTTQTATDYNYTADGSTGKPEHILDGDATTFLSLVKPGKSYSPVPLQSADFTPSFTINMQSPQTFDYIKWQHRGGSGEPPKYNYLRVFAVDVEGSDTGNDNDFTPVNTAGLLWIPNSKGYVGAQTGVDDNIYKIEVPKSTCQYVRVKLKVWSDNYKVSTGYQHPDYPGTGAASGSTMQIAEFGLGVVSGRTSGIESKLPAVAPVSLYPSRIKTGQAFYISLSDENIKSAVSIYSISGVCVSNRNISDRLTEYVIDKKGIYLVEVKQNSEKYIYKVIVV